MMGRMVTRGAGAGLRGLAAVAAVVAGLSVECAAAAPDLAKGQGGAVAPLQATGTENNDPQVTTATYQDWLVRCVTPPSSAKVCEATQTIQVQAQQGQPGGPIAVVAVGRLAADAPLRIAVQLPVGVWLPAGAKLQVGEKTKPTDLEFKRCVQGCFAETEANKDLELALRTVAGNGTLSFEDGARRAVNVPISFRGFTAALDAALKAR